MAKQAWRVQGDIAVGETDPVITVFCGEVYTDEDSEKQVVRQDTSYPLQMKLSELAGNLADPEKMAKMQSEHRAERKAAAARLAQPAELAQPTKE